MTTATTAQLPWWKQPTRKQWAAFLAAWVGWVLDAFDFTIYITVAGSLIKEFGVSPTAIAGSITLTLLVRLLGGFFAGWLADRYGRKTPLMMSLIWFAAFDAAIYFAPTFGWLLVLRTLFGFGMGAEWTAGTSLAMESLPPAARKFASGLLQAGWPIGFLMAAAVSYFVVPAYGWRPMFLIAALPALAVIPIRLMVPNDAPKAAAPGDVAPRNGGALADLWEPSVRRMIILGSLVMALGFVVYYGLTTSYVPLRLELAGCGAKDAVCASAAVGGAWIGQIWFNLGMLLGVVLAGWVANRWGVIAALCTPALLMVPALPLFVGAAPGLLPLGAFLGGALGVGYSGVTPVLTTSLFAERVRARAIGVVYHAGALIAAFVPTIIPALAKALDISLARSIEIVVGTGLVAMAAAVYGLRRSLAPGEAAAEPLSSSSSSALLPSTTDSRAASA